ncbi:MAG TPA: methanol/ethanol family PQQ-dependent dehydrogenase [Gemmatimonadaceae bacterium]|nr:methanol/ethanol family PQQ-dependent dehydrogenase [Gemmatimonadaceae bacterium]
MERNLRFVATGRSITNGDAMRVIRQHTNSPVSLFRLRITASLLLAVAACSTGDDRTRTPALAKASSVALPGASGGAASADASADAPPDDGQWTMPAKNYASTRYSSLAEITAGNVGSLRLVSTFTTGIPRGHEASPLVVNNTMYLVTPYPNYVFALDLTRPGAPMKWTYKPRVEQAAQGVACCDVVNRGAVIADGRLYFNTLDNHTIALDAATGTELWNTKLGDINLGQTMTMAPLVVKGKVLVGNSGGEMGVRGWITALDAGSGKIVWRGYNTGPDSDVLIGADFKPFYASERGKDLGVQTWPSDAWKVGGATTWGWLSYDPELNLVYYGTGNPGPWNPDQRPGDNKWSAGVFARDVDTGAARWFYQMSPHDLFDYDAINESVLIDMPVNGMKKKVLLRAERNGYLYVMDRATGQVYSATPFGYVNSTKGVDLRSGRPINNDEKAPHVGKVSRYICPSSSGTKDFQPTAFSPRTGLLYIPHNNLCMDYEGVEANYIAGTPYVGANVKMYPGPGGHRGEFTAWDPVAQKAVWKVNELFPAWGGALVTGGDVVFYGTMDGWFKALDARNGRELWKQKLGSGIISAPISYRGPDGKQYIAVVDGVGGWSGAIVSGDIDPRDSTAALGMANAMKDLPKYTTKGGSLYIFALK